MALPAPWRTNTALRLLSLPAKGLFFDLLLLMSDPACNGKLISSKGPLTRKDIAFLEGVNYDEVDALLQELMLTGVLVETNQGMIYCPEMIRKTKEAMEASPPEQEQLNMQFAVDAAAQAKRMNGHPTNIPPTLEHMKLLAARIGLPELEVEKCFAYYEMKGWKVGHAPMRNWHMAMSHWKINWQERAAQNKPRSKPKEWNE